jgi:hypothetical protein
VKSIEAVVEMAVDKTLSKVNGQDKEREKFLQTHKILKNYPNLLTVAQKIGSSEYNEAQKVVRVIDTCIDQLKKDPNFDVLELKYFKNFTDEQISEIKDCDRSTIWRQRNELIHKLSYMLFPDQFF